MLNDLYVKYLQLRSEQLLGHTEALEHFEYLHPITLARLVHYIALQEATAS